MKRSVFPLVAFLLWGVTLRAGEPDLVIADFEGADYGDWKATGEAFGPGPAQGTLPDQMPVSGFQGKGLVNSYYHGDGTTGTLTSPAFTIQRKYINFLIGGGGYARTTCVNLLVDGRVVRTATGPNTRPGGSEALEWDSWDVADLAGKQAVIRIVDQRTGGWGHINVDQIVQSERKIASVTLDRELAVDRPYLHLPVKNGARKRLMRLLVDGRMVRQFEIELAEGKPDFWTYTDVGLWRGKTLRIEVERMREDSRALDALVTSDRLPGAEGLYHEALRPQFHFSPARGWTNDPNGLVYHEGRYHLFFQHNPYGTKWGNMTWGHAVSRDLVHWEQRPDAIHPDRLGTIFSGSAVVDEGNTAGFSSGREKAIVCFYTSAGGTNAQSQGQPFAQSMAYSTDGGRSWTKYAGNPVLKHIVGNNRDPKVFWHRPSRQWIMALFLDQQQYALFASPNLKQWARLSDVPKLGCGECPDMFELPVDGDPGNRRWVFWGGSGNYLVGTFDGKRFTRQSGPHSARFGANDYAAQTYSDIPAKDGRRIQLAWMAGGRYPGMPFNQQMTAPRVLTLRTTPEGIRLFIEPVEELKSLRDEAHSFRAATLAPGENPLAELTGRLWDIEAEIEPGEAERVGFEVRGHKIEYVVGEKKLVALGRTAPVALVDGRLKLRLLVDRASVEVFAGDGRVSMATCFLPEENNQSLGVYAAGGKARVASLVVWKMKSIWDSP